MSAALTPDTADALYRAVQYHAGWLRKNGWVCIPPIDADAPVPEPAVGQVWRSPRIRTEARTVVSVSDCCITYAMQRSVEHLIRRTGWDKWVGTASARPENGSDWAGQKRPDGEEEAL